MDYLVICVAALLTSALTLFSGFGLGTLLLPAFAAFFPVSVAVAMTAIVHVLNNLFKLLLVGKRADRGAVVRFGVPAVAAALLGAWSLGWLSGLSPVARYHLFGAEREVLIVNLVVAVLMIVFAVLEAVPALEKIKIDRRWLPMGGALSGFLGGLSGHQGALRSAFLLKIGLTRESYIATGVAIAVMVDVSRISVYATRFADAGIGENAWLLSSAVVSAFVGAFFGSRLMKKVTMRAVNILVSILLVVTAIGLGSGLIGK